MQLSAQDKDVLGGLAQKYSELSQLDIQKERIERYRKTNDLEDVKPIVLINEVPWGEIDDDALKCVCDPELGWLEGQLRRTLYQWEHFQVDMVIPPVFRIAKSVKWLSGIGIEVQEEQINADSGSHIKSHAYEDLLQTEEDVEKLTIPEIAYDKEYSESCFAIARDIFDGLMDVELAGGGGVGYNIWDTIARYRGVQDLLMDLALKPDLMHKIARKFTDIAKTQIKQMEEQGLLNPRQYLVHCTAALSKDLPADDFDGTVRLKDVWGRTAAQIFGEVSPQMHDEFDLVYGQELFDECGLVYYGCCEPMDTKIDILRNRFKNLRKVSITPWADPKRAAENMGNDLVMAAKPNPAFVAMPNFNPESVKKEISGYCEAAKANGTPLEFVIKDISTIANNPQTLTQWAVTTQTTIDKYYS